MQPASNGLLCALATHVQAYTYGIVVYPIAYHDTQLSRAVHCRHRICMTVVFDIGLMIAVSAGYNKKTSLAAVCCFGQMCIFRQSHLQNTCTVLS